MEYTREQIEKMDNSELRKITFDECPCKCCNAEADCDKTPVGKCREHLLNNLTD